MRNDQKELRDQDLNIEVVDLGDLDTLEEDIVPCTGCGCTCNGN